MVNYIYLFRHGQSTFNRDGKFTGWLDAKLTEKGRANARAIACELKNRKIDAAIHTRLSRSKETLNIVLKGHKECKKILKDDRMIERSYGIYQGKSHKWFMEKFGEERYRKIHRGYTAKAPKGESFRDVEKRVKKFIKWLRKYVKKNKVNIAISAHGNSIRIFRKVFENKTRGQAVKWNIPYDKVFVYRIRD